MFKELLEWFAPGHREAFEKVFTDLVARVEALETRMGLTTATPAAPAEPAAPAAPADPTKPAQ